jgi:hypothetical protein
MKCTQAGHFKTQYSEAALVDPELKTASFLVFTIMYRMSRTILEQLAVSKILAEEWKGMAFSSSTDSMDMLQKIRSGETIRKHNENVMPHLSVALKLQTRGQTHSGKLALQRFVALFETGVSNGDLESAMVYFQIVQDLFISETQTHSIDNGGSAIPDLEKINRDLKRQIQTLQAQSGNTGPVNTVKAAVVANAGQVSPTTSTFQQFNKTCTT